MSRCTSPLPVICASRRATSKLSSKDYSTSPTGWPVKHIRTLDPEKLVSVGQPILTLSGAVSLQVPLDARLLDFHHAAHNCSFGIFHWRVWREIPANIAQSLLASETSFPFPPENIDPNLTANGRLISTLSSQRLASMNQRIVNISGMYSARISFGGKTCSDLHYVSTRSSGAAKFPPNTTGVFYYYQSQSAPTQLGELRFRLCSDIHKFERGSDLYSVHGGPWFLSSQSIFASTDDYKSICEHLVEEGLLERSLYPGVPNSMLGSGIPPLTKLNQPFQVDLSVRRQLVNLHNLRRRAAPPHQLQLAFIFRNEAHANVPVFSGRAVVQLEEYPASELHNPGFKHRPVLALRILEFLTPIKRLSSDTKVPDPVPGQLLMRRYHGSGEYVPWSYSPRAPDTCSTIADWIRAQSTSPKHLDSE
ncbi:hypothetical protein D9619_011733 [Psilocybe cf. subviscida]|uniref:Uncharacterized protein n=1 Tax=Psilocybe cf. subviscida TaxID=2480587 RepID=A0A8H5BT31_9AGAR|nr:hypothetical protein D9619_011733 [Psilocybe cf. subviscida]